MGHIPHLLVPPPWDGARLAIAADALHHLRRVLRREAGARLTYTDGAGTVGEGTLEDGALRRGAERTVAAPPDITIAVAAPHAADRLRFLVEKCAELGVRRLLWISTEFGRNRTPKPEKSRAWAVAALQQSQGAHLMRIEGPVRLDELRAAGSVLVADPAGEPASGIEWHPPITVVIGPEGGFAPAETAERRLVSFGDRVLRTETTAVVAAALALHGCHGR